MAGWQEYDEQSTFIAQFRWSPDFSPKRVAETYKTELPVIVKVTSGYDGCDGMHEFAMEEVYCIVDIKKQKRVVMTDIQDRYISIPFDYHVKFHTVGSNNKPEGPARPLSEICPTDSSSLNTSLRMMFEQNQAVKFNDGADLGSKVQLGVIEYDEVYKERYLVCHPLQSNEILSDVVIIPIYVPISLSVAECFVNAPPDSFSGWMRCISASVQAFDTTGIQACTEIVVFEESPAGDYTYINPLNLFQHSLGKGDSSKRDSDDTKRYLNITQCKEKQRGRISIFGAQLPPLLDKGQGQGRNAGATKATTSAGPPLPPRNLAKAPSPEKDSPPVIPGPRKTSGSTSSSGSTSGQKKSPVTPSAPSKVKRDEVKATRPSSPATTPTHGVTDILKRPTQPLPVKDPVTPPAPPQTGSATRIVKTPEHPANESSGLKQTPPVNAKKAMPSKPAQDYRIADALHNKSKSGLSQDKLFKGDCPPFIKDCPPFIKGAPPQWEVPPELVDYETLDEATLTRSPGGLKSPDAKVSPKLPHSSPTWKSVEDIPVGLNIGALTVDELCRCLELLKMDRFAELFRVRMVDGCLLLDLTNETLRSEFGMTLFDATKLMKFAREGWRPKTQ